jgi:phosphonate transport system substrate-binding protein
MSKYITLISLFLSLFTSSISYASQSYSFGIVPQQSASKMAKLWVPILNYVSKVSGHKLVFKTAKNIPKFEEQLSAGNYDFSYMNPYHYTVFHKKSDYQAISKAKDKRIKGIIVVKKDSSYKTLEDFDKQTLAFPSPAAFAASILPRAEFQQKGIQVDTKYVSSHDSVYRNVAQGRYVAGGGVIRTFKNTEADIREKLKVLWTTEGFTPHAIAAHSKIPEAHRLEIQQAFAQMADTSKGKELLGNIKIKGFENANNADWDDVRALKIELLK